jgi:hypothetical protein
MSEPDKLRYPHIYAFVKSDIVPTEFQNIEAAVDVCFQKLITFLSDMTFDDIATMTWNCLLFNQYVFEPNTDNGASDIMNHYVSQLDDSNEVREFAEAVKKDNINVEVVKHIKFGGF